MKNFTIFICIFILINKCLSKEIKQLYFDPQTSMSSSKQDGVVIIETKDGVKSTICMNFDSATNNAQVICRMMGYNVTTQKLNAVALISTKKSTFTNKTHFQDIKCQGRENDLSECLGFEYHEAIHFKCQNQNQDLHVFCMGPHHFPKTTINAPPSSYNCSSHAAGSNSLIASVTNRSHGLLKIRNGTEEFTICGINRNFGANEARLFCNHLLCQQSAHARIIEGYYVEGANIGGFKNMKCPHNATSLRDCDNVYPHDNERCTPNDNIGVLCGSDPTLPDPNPEVFCDESSLTLHWETKKHPNIDPELVSIVDNGNRCKDVQVDKSVRLTVKYTDCGMLKQGDNETIIYNFQARRSYPKINDKIIIKNDQLFNVSCLISRNDSSTQATFEISNIVDLPVIGGNAQIPTLMVVSPDNKFQQVLSNIKDVDIGKDIYVKVHLVQPPPQLVPFLDTCYVESGQTSVPVIINKCPARPDVVISPLSSSTIMFSFQTFAIGQVAEPAFIRCVTSMCGRNSLSCIPTCQRLA